MQEASSQVDQSLLSQISPDDAFGRVFGQEHPGRVRGLGMGVCPTSVFGISSQRFGGIHSSSSSSTHHVNQDEFERLKSKLDQNEDKLHRTEDKLHRAEEELAETRAQVHAIMDFIKSMGGCLPANLFTQPPTNQQVLECLTSY